MPTQISGDTGVSQIQDNTVTSAKIVNGAVTPDDLAQKLTLGTKQTASGSTLTFSGIPSWVKRITLTFGNLSSNGSADFVVRIGPVAGVESSGYLGTSVVSSSGGNGAANFAIGFPIAQNLQGAGFVVHGQMILTLLDPSLNFWVCSSVAGESDAGRFTMTGGSKAIAGVLSVLTLSTTDSFDNGTVNVLYEG
jgi:hypothetical protein